MESKLKGTLTKDIPHKGILISFDCPEVGQSFHGYKPNGTSWHTSAVQRIDWNTKTPERVAILTQNSHYDIEFVTPAELAAIALVKGWHVRLNPFARKGAVIRMERKGDSLEVIQKGDDNREWAFYM